MHLLYLNLLFYIEFLRFNLLFSMKPVGWVLTQPTGYALNISLDKLMNFEKK